jgi:hypothetical protein
LPSKQLKYEGFWKYVKPYSSQYWICQDQKEGAGELTFPDGSRHKGDFFNDEPVVSRAVSSKERRRRSFGHCIITDGDRIESNETDVTSPGLTTKGSDAVQGVRKSKHERSRSFVDTVGRRIHDPAI